MLHESGAKRNEAHDEAHDDTINLAFSSLAQRNKGMKFDISKVDDKRHHYCC
jgi:hypothetical protein